MPCDSSSGSSGDYAWSAANKANDRIDELKKEVDLVTRFLCSVLRNWKADDFTKLDPEIQDWFIKHMEHDKRNGRP